MIYEVYKYPNKFASLLITIITIPVFYIFDLRLLGEQIGDLKGKMIGSKGFSCSGSYEGNSFIITWAKVALDK